MVRARRRRDGGKERFWRGVVARWRRSGLGVRAFCDREGLSEASFYAWRRELLLREREAQAQTVPSSRVVPGRPAVPLFVPVEVQAPAGLDRPASTANAANSMNPTPPQASTAAGVVIVLSGGREVRVAPGFDDRTLRRVLAVLEAAPGSREASAAAEGGPC